MKIPISKLQVPKKLQEANSQNLLSSFCGLELEISLEFGT
jgi:hypothetical protein